MPVLPFPAWQPDISDLNGASTTEILNVLPRADGYGPMRSASPFTDNLPAQCRGFFMARRTDGTIRIFAGTATKLYLLNNTTLGWTDVSKAAGTYTEIPTKANWSFRQFGDVVIACQVNTVPQAFNIQSPSTAFADLAGSPPQASDVAIINRFLVLSGLLNNPNRVQWSGLNAITTWTPGTSFSDYQDMPDGGAVQRVVGGEFGIVLQDGTIRRMVFVPGSDVIFQFDRIATDIGTVYPSSVVESNGLIYFYSPKGFVKITPDGGPTYIGYERVDRTFGSAADFAKANLIQGVADPESNNIIWTYTEEGFSGSLFNRWLVYNTVLNRWAPLAIEGEAIASIGKPGLTLEALGALDPVAITDAVDNGSGLIRLEVADTTGWTTNDIKDIHDVGGTTEANGTWTITVIDGTHIDLQGSTFANAYVDGGYVAGSLDDLEISLDDFSNATLTDLAMFDADGRLGYFSGATLEAIMTAAEQSGISKRLFIRGAHPITDATEAYVSIGARESMKVAASYSAETAVNAQGFCPQRVSTRHARGKLRIPEAATWTFATGIEPDYTQEGRR